MHWMSVRVTLTSSCFSTFFPTTSLQVIYVPECLSPVDPNSRCVLVFDLLTAPIMTWNCTKSRSRLLNSTYAYSFTMNLPIFAKTSMRWQKKN
ncbi:hypothetical protein FOPG_17780 [Fusarium oxysporum f. sp. conglutinans race 2 54008]|uniref:Secreted protein n=1 Tax=Fusarium oxysporum f. sp. conglutinans race 2 54008 TaxID=1089457 RepID=X0HY27_FUSOX|nr:hypothetical protein FOPG_17780 [Fusarium oxysporum f. sp. conglutinans race 2 54008]